MFPGILLLAKVLKYGCVIIHTSVLVVFKILRLVCITIYILFILTVTRFYILSHPSCDCDPSDAYDVILSHTPSCIVKRKRKRKRKRKEI